MENSAPLGYGMGELNLLDNVDTLDLISDCGVFAEFGAGHMPDCTLNRQMSETAKAWEDMFVEAHCNTNLTSFSSFNENEIPTSGASIHNVNDTETIPTLQYDVNGVPISDTTISSPIVNRDIAYSNVSSNYTVRTVNCSRLDPPIYRNLNFLSPENSHCNVMKNTSIESGYSIPSENCIHGKMQTFSAPNQQYAQLQNIGTITKHVNDRLNTASNTSCNYGQTLKVPPTTLFPAINNSLIAKSSSVLTSDNDKRSYNRTDDVSEKTTKIQHGKLKTRAKRRRMQNIDQRKAANVRERRRMTGLNSAFEVLKNYVPTFSYEKKISRIETLRLASTYITFMTQLLEGVQPDQIRLPKANIYGGMDTLRLLSQTPN